MSGYVMGGADIGGRSNYNPTPAEQLEFMQSIAHRLEGGGEAVIKNLTELVQGKTSQIIQKQ